MAHHGARSDSRTVRMGVLTTFIGRAFPPVAALVTAPLLAVGLGVTGRGELAAALAPLLVATSIAPVGIPAAVNHAVARTPAVVAVAARRAALLVAASGLVAVAVTIAARSWLSGGDAQVAGSIAIAALAIVPTVLIAVVQAAAAGLGRWRLVAAERIVASTVKVVAIAGLFWSDGLTPETAVVASAFAPVLGGLVYLALHRATSPTAAPSGPGATTTTGATTAVHRDTVGYGALLRYGVGFWLGAAAGILLLRLDQLLFLPIGGAHQLGLYVVAVTISEATLILNAAVRDVLFTHDAARSDDARLTRASRMSTLATALTAALIAATAWWWLPVLFGPAFVDALPALLVLLAAIVLGNPGSIAGTGLSARGRPALRSASLVIACAVNVAAFLLVVPLWGAVGAAVATLVGNLVASNLNLLFLRRTSGTRVAAFYAIGLADLRGLVALGSDLRRTRSVRS